MNRTQIVADLFNNTTKGTFAALSMNAQVAVAYRAAKRTLSNVKYWTTRAEEATDDTSHKYAKDMLSKYEQCLPGLYLFINRASHYSEGISQIVEHEIGGADDYGNVSEGSEWVNVVLNGKPHAWAKRLLVEADQWPENLDFSEEHKLVIPDMDDVADRIAGQQAARFITVLGAGDHYVPKGTDARDCEIAALSPAALSIAKLKSAEDKLRASFQLALKHRPFGVSEKQLRDAFAELIQLDEDDEVEAEIRITKRTMRKEVNQIVRSASMAAIAADTATRLKAAGLGDDVIAATLAKMFP
jgi:hypothetical protein